MRRSVDPTDKDIWSGGEAYELGLTFSSTDDNRLAHAQRALHTAAKLRPAGRRGWLVRLPDGRRTNCVTTSGQADDESWLFLHLIGTGLARLYRQVHRQMLDPAAADHDPMRWSRPVDDWLAAVAAEVFTVVPFRLGRIGWGVSLDPPVVPKRPATQPHTSLLVPRDGELRYLPATG